MHDPTDRVNLPRMALAVTLIVGASLLAGCGGGSGSGAAAADAVPSSALATSDAFTRFVGARRADERADPLRLEGVQPPVSDVDEPLPLR